MEESFINTQVGKIAVYQKKVKTEKIPVVFLHGVYFDHHLWDNQVNQINDRTIIVIDMPLHGKSKEKIKSNWDLNDCADMLIEGLDSLNIDKVIAVGHSWGSMTIIRAANKKPEHFAALGLCNMPFKAPTTKERRAIKVQHTALTFRNFYMKLVGKSLMGRASLSQNPGLLKQLITPMSKLSNKEIKYTDQAVRMNAEDATQIIKNISIPTISIIGEEDYVHVPPIEQTQTVKGGHISPIEVPEPVNELVTKLTNLVESI